jgi:hypothetical protein
MDLLEDFIFWFKFLATLSSSPDSEILRISSVALAFILWGLAAWDLPDLPFLGVFGFRGDMISGIMDSSSWVGSTIRSAYGRGHEPPLLREAMASTGWLVLGRESVPFFFYLFDWEIPLSGFLELVGSSIMGKILLWV